MSAPLDRERGSAILVRSQACLKLTLDLHLKIDGERMQLEAAFVMVRALRCQFTKAQDSAGEATTLFEEEIMELFVRQFCQTEAREGMIDKHHEMFRPHGTQLQSQTAMPIKFCYLSDLLLCRTARQQKDGCAARPDPLLEQAVDACGQRGRRIDENEVGAVPRGAAKDAAKAQTGLLVQPAREGS